MKQQLQHHQVNTPARSPQIQKTEPTSLAVVMRPVASLIPDPRNARIHTAKHVAQIAASISAFRFNVPILIDAKNQVIAGHGRLLAAQHLGWLNVPTVMLEHLTPDQVRAYRLADNRLTDCSTWDERLLAEQLKALSEAELDFDLGAIGFDMPEIDLLIQGLDVLDEADDAADLAVANGPPLSKLGDVWLLGRHRIVCGSALEADSYDALMGTDQAAMAFIDPPYNCKVSMIGGNGSIQHAEFVQASGELSHEEFTAFLSQALGLLKRYTKPGAMQFVCMDWRGIAPLTAAIETQGLVQKNLCVWDKGVGGMGSLYRSQFELVFVLKSGNAPHTNNVQLGKYGRNRTNVWRYDGMGAASRKTSEGNLLALHPTCKPVPLVANAILDVSDRGERVLDCFLGSGTTIIAAEKTGRTGLGIELDPKYVDVAIRRWQRLTGEHAVHADSGQTFAQREQEGSQANVQSSSTATRVEGETA